MSLSLVDGGNIQMSCEVFIVGRSCSVICAALELAGEWSHWVDGVRPEPENGHQFPPLCVPETQPYFQGLCKLARMPYVPLVGTQAGVLKT